MADQLEKTNLQRHQSKRESDAHKKAGIKKVSMETGLLTIPHSLPTAKQEVLEQKETAVTDASTPVISIPYT